MLNWQNVKLRPAIEWNQHSSIALWKNVWFTPTSNSSFVSMLFHLIHAHTGVKLTRVSIHARREIILSNLNNIRKGWSCNRTAHYIPRTKHMLELHSILLTLHGRKTFFTNVWWWSSNSFIFLWLPLHWDKVTQWTLERNFSYSQFSVEHFFLSFMKKMGFARVQHFVKLCRREIFYSKMNVNWKIADILLYLLEIMG